MVIIITEEDSSTGRSRCGWVKYISKRRKRNNNAIDITAGNFKYTPGTEGSGKVLTSDANGVASWQTPSGGGGGVTTAVAPLSITTNTISIQTPTSGTVLGRTEQHGLIQPIAYQTLLQLIASYTQPVQIQ